MRDLAAILRGELAALEAELASDPRLRKAEKIRELLAMYEDLPDGRNPGPTRAAPKNRATAPAVIKENPKVNRMRWVIQIFMRQRGSATLARSRLVEMAKTNQRPNASSSAWLQLQTEPSASSVPTAALASVPMPTTS